MALLLPTPLMPYCGAPLGPTTCTHTHTSINATNTHPPSSPPPLPLLSPFCPPCLPQAAPPDLANLPRYNLVTRGGWGMRGCQAPPLSVQGGLPTLRV